MKFRGTGRRWAASSGIATVTLLVLAAGTQTAATAAVQHRASAPPANPYAPAYHHPYRHGAVPTRAAAAKMRTWASQHTSGGTGNAAAKAASAVPPLAPPLTYGGGPAGVMSGTPKVYLVFYGSQWGAQGTNNSGDLTLSGDPAGMAPYLQELFRGLGTGGEQWSGVMTQYCDGVGRGAMGCGPGFPAVGYPLGGALAGVWVDEHAASPATATPAQLGTEAVTAAGHFGNTTAAANRNVQYVIVSPHGTHPDSFSPSGPFCAWHDDNVDPYVGVSSPYGNVAFTNLPYLPDAGSNCGASYVNSGSSGALDGVSIMAGDEYADTITDTTSTAGGSQGWFDANGYETSTQCAWQNGSSANVTLTTGTFALQSTWANDGGGLGGACELSHPVATGDLAGDTVSVTSPGGQFSVPGSAITPLPVTASDSDSAQTLAYSAAGLPPGLSIGSASGAITGTPTAGGTYSVTVTATDGTGASGAADFTWAVGLLKNPGFETGSISPWTSTAGVLRSASATLPASSGHWLARLDGAGGKHTDTLAQKVTISKSWTKAAFSFWLSVQTNDPTNKAYDKLTVQVLNSKGKVLKTLATFSNRNKTTGYVQHSYSLSSYRGQTITIKFTGKETLTKHNTAFLVDDNALTTS